MLLYLFVTIEVLHRRAEEYIWFTLCMSIRSLFLRSFLEAVKQKHKVSLFLKLYGFQIVMRNIIQIFKSIISGFLYRHEHLDYRASIAVFISIIGKYNLLL